MKELSLELVMLPYWLNKTLSFWTLARVVFFLLMDDPWTCRSQNTLLQNSWFPLEPTF